MPTERITGAKIAIWLNSNYRNAQNQPVTCVAYPPVIPDFPAELVIITLQPGTGHDHDKAFEVIRFQVRCRSPQNNPQVAEANSVGIDDMLNRLVMPWKPMNGHVIDLGWSGGGPAPVSPDDSSNRYSWVCNYFGRAATGY